MPVKYSTQNMPYQQYSLVENTEFKHTMSCTLMRDEMVYTCRNKEASKVKQTTRQSNTAHPRQSLFEWKNEHVHVYRCTFLAAWKAEQ